MSCRLLVEGKAAEQLPQFQASPLICSLLWCSLLGTQGVVLRQHTHHLTLAAPAHNTAVSSQPSSPRAVPQPQQHSRSRSAHQGLVLSHKGCSSTTAAVLLTKGCPQPQHHSSSPAHYGVVLHHSSSPAHRQQQQSFSPRAIPQAQQQSISPRAIPQPQQQPCSPVAGPPPQQQSGCRPAHPHLTLPSQI